MTNLRAPTNLILFAIAALAVTLFAIYRTPYAIDDAWITYRYAENIAAGRGMVYNPGEQVLGTSTPLYTLLLAVVRFCGAAVPVASQVIGLVAMLGAIIGVFLLVRRAHSEMAALVAAGLLVSMTSFNQVATFGMETPLYVCLIVFAFYFYATDRLYAFALVAALCALVRLDGLAVGFAGFVSYGLVNRKVPFKALVFFAVCFIPWAAFSLFYFGNIFPHSFLAKRVQADYQLSAWMLDWLSKQPHTLLAIVGAGASIANPASRNFGVVLVVWCLGYVTAFCLSALGFFAWYVTPLSLVLASLAGVGIMVILHSAIHGRALRGFALVAMLVFLIFPDARLLRTRLRGDLGVERIDQVRYDAVQWLSRNVPKDAMIVSGGIGMVGYFTGNYILDAAGLVSPQVVGPYSPAWPTFLPFIIVHYQPEYVFEAFPSVPDYMKDDYSVVRTWETGDPYFQRFYLLRRAPTSSPSSTNASNGVRR